MLIIRFTYFIFIFKFHQFKCYEFIKINMEVHNIHLLVSSLVTLCFPIISSISQELWSIMFLLILFSTFVIIKGEFISLFCTHLKWIKSLYNISFSHFSYFSITKKTLYFRNLVITGCTYYYKILNLSVNIIMHNSKLFLN